MPRIAPLAVGLVVLCGGAEVAAAPADASGELAIAQTHAEPVATVESAASEPAVPDATWSALEGKRISVETAGAPVEGELASAEGSDLVLVADDGTVLTVPKADAKGVKVTRREPAPAPEPTASEAEPKPGDAAPDDAKKDDAKKDKPKREHALLGAFSAHGAAYANWRGQGVSSGHAAYLMDWGIGINPTPGFGMYAMAGGVLGARIDDKQIRANYGHFDLMFAFGGKYYHSMFGAGLGLSRLKTPTETQKDIGLSLPFKIFGKIPLPHHLYIGLGLSYELALVRDWHRFVNVIGGQLVVGRW